ncbi:MAG: histidine phosphatase family protein [Burkholderiaceae bacterium]
MSRPIDRRRFLNAAGLSCVATTALLGAGSSGAVEPGQLRHWLTGSTRARLLIMRHAQTVAGTGDPPGYRLDDCATQRNLGPDGRAQARALAAMVQAAKLRFDEVRSSRWCRCLETAQIAFGQVEGWPPLDSFFDAREQGPSQLALLREALQALRPGRTVAWVTHQVVITGLTGVWPASGEVLIIEPGHHAQPPAVIGRFIPA